MNSEYNSETAKYIELWEQSQMGAEQLDEVSPPGFKGTVKAMKKHKDEIDNPYALAWHMKNKGDKAHYKNKDGKPEKKEKYKDEDEKKSKKKKMGCDCGKMNCESFDSWLEQNDPNLAEWIKEQK